MCNKMKTQSNIRIKRVSGKKMKTQSCSYETNPKINNMHFFFFHLVRMKQTLIIIILFVWT